MPAIGVRPLTTFASGAEATKAERERRDQFRNITTQDIEDQYQNHQITLYDRNNLLRQKAHYEVFHELEDSGLLSTMFNEGIRQFQKGWETLREAIQGDNIAASDAHIIGYTLWGMAQMLMTPFKSRDVVGDKLEDLALGAGASPGAAHILGTAFNVGTDFIPIGKMVQGFAKGVQGFAGMKTVAKEGEAAKGVSDAVEAQVVQTITQGLQKDGLKEAPIFTREGRNKIAQDIAETQMNIVNPTVVARRARSFDGEFKRQVKSAPEKVESEIKPMLKKLGLDKNPPQIIKDAKSRTELYAYLKTLEVTTGELNRLARLALRGDPEAKYTFARYATDLFSSSYQTKHAAESFNDLLIKWDPVNMGNNNILGAIETLARDIVAIGNKKAMTKFIIQSQDGYMSLGEIWPGIRELYLNALLTTAWAPTFVGNLLSVGVHVQEQAVGAMFSADRAAGMVLKEPFYFVKGMQLAIGDATKMFGRAFNRMDKSGAQQYLQQVGSRLDYIPQEIPGRVGRFLNIPSSATIGMDGLFTTMIKRGVMYEKAIREAEHAGLKGTAAGRYILNYAAMPPTLQYAKEAESIAKELTFQNQLGWFGTRLTELLHAGPGTLYFPFIRSGVDLAKWGWYRTPGLQLIGKQLYDDIRAGGVKADMAIGRLTLSNMWGLFWWELAKDGYITGSGPLHRALQPEWRATHEPYSAATPSGWLDLKNYQPLSMPIGAIADFTQIIDTLDDPTIEQTAMALVFAGLQDFADNTFWWNASDMIDVIQGVTRGEDITHRKAETIARPVLSFLTPPVVGRVARIMDPVQRETRTLLDSLIAKTPGLSATLPPKRDGYLDPIVPSQAAGNSWFGLINPIFPKIKEGTTDRLKIEGDKLKVKLPQYGWSIGGHTQEDGSPFDITKLEDQPLGVSLTPEERDRWQVIAREMLRDPKIGVETLFKLPEWTKPVDEDGWTINLKRKTFELMLQRYKTSAGQMLLLEKQELMDKWLRSRVQNVEGLVGPEERARLRQEIELRPFATQDRENLTKYGTYEEGR